MNCEIIHLDQFRVTGISRAQKKKIISEFVREHRMKVNERHLEIFLGRAYESESILYRDLRRFRIFKDLGYGG